nr:Uncharacterised protein [Klebsiella pneumoniae]
MASSSRSMPVSSVAAMAIATLSTVAPLTRIPGSAVLPAAMRGRQPLPPHRTPRPAAVPASPARHTGPPAPAASRPLTAERPSASPPGVSDKARLSASESPPDAKGRNQRRQQTQRAGHPDNRGMINSKAPAAMTTLRAIARPRGRSLPRLPRRCSGLQRA